RTAEGRFHFESEDSLWGLLVLMTLRKCGKQIRHYFGPEHDLRREVAADDASSWEALTNEPPPEEASLLAELVEQCLRPLDERERPVLERRLQGWTVPEISKQVGLTEYTVEGMLKRIRKKLEHLHE